MCAWEHMGAPMQVDVARRSLSGCGPRQKILASATRPHGSLQPRLQQSSQAAAGLKVGDPSMQLQDSMRYSSSAVNSSAQMPQMQQRLSAMSLLERSAAAPRPAVIPEQLEASTSASSSSSSSARRRGNRVGAQSSSTQSMAADMHSSGMHDYWDSQQHKASTAAASAAASTAAEVSLLVSPSDMGQTATMQSYTEGDSITTSSSSSSRDDPRQLSEADWQVMQDIMHHTNSWQDLAQVVEQQASQFTASHCAAALYRLAAVWQQQEQYVRVHEPRMRAELRLQYPAVLQLAGVLLRALQQQIAAAEARDLADALYAAIKLGFKVEQQYMDVEGPGASAQRSIRSISQQQQYDTEDAAAVDVLPDSILEAMQQQSQALLLSGDMEPRQLARLLWAFAQLGLQPASDWWAVALDAAADKLQQQLVHDVLQDQDHLQQHWFTPQGLAITGWAVAKLRAPATGAWWQCYMTTAAALLPQMEPQHLSNCIWALATAQQTMDSSWMNRFYSSSRKYLHTGHREKHEADQGAACVRFEPQGLANILWALAALQQQPPLQWQQQFEAVSLEQLSGSSMQHLSMMLWAYGRMHNNSSRSSSGSRPSQQQQQQQPSAAWLGGFWAQLSRVESEATPQGVACILWALVQLDVHAPDQHLQQLERSVCEVLHDAQPQAVAVIVWALGVLRGQSTSRAVVKCVRRYCSYNHQQLYMQLTPQGLVMLLYGLSKFNAWHPDWFKQQLLAAVTSKLQQCLSGSSSCSNSSTGSRAGFKSHELPIVLLLLVHLRINLPTALLEQVDGLLLQQQDGQHQQQHQQGQQQQRQQQQGQQRLQIDSLSVGELSTCLYALGVAKHHPSVGFMEAAAARVQQQVLEMCQRDVAFVLYGLAAMANTGEQQRMQQQEELLQRLLVTAERVLANMDHKCLAMVMWSLARLQLRPSEQFLQQCLAATTDQLPNMTLLSVTSILAALQSLEYLPPIPWMVETCKAARAKVNTDPTPKPYQRRDCVRRLEEAVVWFNGVVQQQQQQQHQGSEDARSRGVQRRVADAVLKGAAGVLGAGNTSSEAVIAAAVGVAAAVAQQWRW